MAMIVCARRTRSARLLCASRSVVVGIVVYNTRSTCLRHGSVRVARGVAGLDWGWKLGRGGLAPCDAVLERERLPLRFALRFRHRLEVKGTTAAQLSVGSGQCAVRRREEGGKILRSWISSDGD